MSNYFYYTQLQPLGNPNNQPAQQTQLTNNSYIQPAIKRTQKDTIFAQICSALYTGYILGQNRHGTIFFMNVQTKVILLPNDPSLRNQLIRIAYEITGKEPSKTTIQNAIDAAKGSTQLIPIYGPIAQRIEHRDGMIGIVCQKSGLFWNIGAEEYKPRLLGIFYNSNSLGYPHNPLISPSGHLTSGTERTVLTPILPPSPRNDALFEITNLPRSNKYMILAWIVLTFCPRCNQLALQMTGDSLVGKTHAQQTIRTLIDPNDSIIQKPKSFNDIHPHLLESYVPILDDVEELTRDAQITLSKCLTLYAYDLTPRQKENTLIDITRPLLINGLESVVTEGSLSRRTITLELSDDEQSENKRLENLEPPSQQLHETFSLILQLVEMVGREWNRPWAPPIDAPNELHDYYHIGHIIGSHYNYQQDDGTWVNPFYQEIKDYQSQERDRFLQEDCVVLAIYTWAYHHNNQPQKNTLENWRKILYAYSQDAPDWPSNAKQLSRRLRQHKRLLNEHGIHVENHGRSGPNYFWTIGRKTPKDPEDPSHEPD